jgi:hypothetical protein
MCTLGRDSNTGLVCHYTQDSTYLRHKFHICHVGIRRLKINLIRVGVASSGIFIVHIKCHEDLLLTVSSELVAENMPHVILYIISLFSVISLF